jgi:hypothetical protein
MLASGLKPACEKALRTVVRENDAKGLHALLAGGVALDLDDAGGLLLEAAQYSATQCLALLLGLEDVPVNARTASGWTALAYAARNNCAANIRLLLEAGADPAITFKAYLRNGERMVTAPELAGGLGHYNAADAFAEHARRQRAAQPALAAPRAVPALPAPPAAAEQGGKEGDAAPETAPECPPGWRAVCGDGAALAVQEIEDAESGLRVRNIFDFKGRRLLTQFGDAAGPLSASDRGFAELDPAFVAEAERIFAALRERKKAGIPPGLT